jgi:hypothetical protein
MDVSRYYNPENTTFLPPSLCQWRIQTPESLWDMRFSRRRLWRLLSSGTWRLHLQGHRDVFNPEDKGNRFLLNVGKYLTHHMTPHSGRQSFSRILLTPMNDISLSLSLSLWLYSHSDLGRLFNFLIYTKSVVLFGRGISPSQRRYLHTEQHKHRINAHTHPCLE